MKSLGWREMQRMDARRELVHRAWLVGACLAVLLVLCLSGCNGKGADALAFAGAALVWVCAGLIAVVGLAAVYGLVQMLRDRL